ncbi:uncharacterized protein DUF481 [Neolewinella xylanilytica]|uniref:Uncharacterized protein DUF481 n=1 Tax=Neolewinella xylanilytica TaxID=1514080 RepID=A0A2S6I0B4_9BACT|nr:DUF481 domain-containing protein [Neolewinella xylanilytica]PPK84301.1 uncharacterized protein DUF481 [Neolewinella xylanilytica]
MNWIYRIPLLCLVLFCTRATAQIVNIEDKRKGFDTVGWYGQIDLGANLTRNVNQVISVNGAIRVDRKGRTNSLLGIADYKLVQVSGDNALNAGFGHLRHAYYLSDKWRWETFGQLQYNEQIRLQLRGLLGTGPRLKVLSIDNNRVYLGTLYMYEYDEVAEGEIIYRSHRLSSYLSFNLYPWEQLSVSNTTYYQPVLPDFQMPRISTVTSLSLKVTTRLSVQTSFSLTHDPLLNQGLPDVPNTTYEWINGLRYSF